MSTAILRAYQEKKAQEQKEHLAKMQQEQQDYLESEQYLKDEWEKYQDLWEKKAQKEGWHYTRKPFVSAADRQRQSEQHRQNEIAFLEERLKALKGE